jgi:hypothetical protein
MNRCFRAAALMGLLSTALAMSTASRPARADDETLSKCIAESNQSVDLRKQGRLLEARKALALCAAPSCGTEVSDACQKGIADINGILPSVVFVPRNGAGEDVAGVKLSVDGAPYAERLDGSAVVIDPGEHEFRFEVAGQQPVSKRFVLREGEVNRREEILIGPPPPAPRPAPQAAQSIVVVNSAAPTAKPQLDSTGSFQRTVGTVLLAVGLPIGVIATASYGIVAATSWSSVPSECNTSCGSGSQAQRDRQAAGTAASNANIAGVLTGVVLVGGIVLRVTAPARRPLAAPSDVRVVPTVSDRGGGVLVSGSFL